jgi:hypothetical protein
VTLPLEARFRHLYIPGRSGYGKSNLMAQLALDDIDEGFGCAVIDPKGDTVDRILEWIPTHRKDDVYYISGKTPVSLDLMFYDSPAERSQIAQQVYALFERLMALGERMGPVLEYAINTVMQMPSRCFLDIYHLLQKDDDTFDTAMQVIEKTAPPLFHFWHVRYKQQYFNHADIPLTTRMTSFILIPVLEQLLGSRKPAISIPKIIASNKILLVNLQSLGDIAGYIAGCLITSQIQHAIFRRQSIPEDDRIPYFFHADEFQDFRNRAFNKLIQQARGFHLGLTLANQHPKQDGITDLWDDIKGCVTGGYFIFQMDETHAALLKSQIRPYRPDQLTEMPQGTCLYKPMNAEPRFWDAPLLPKYNPQCQAVYIKQRMLTLIAQCPPTSRQRPPTDTELGHDDRPGPKTGPPHSQPPPSKRPLSRPRNPR